MSRSGIKVSQECVSLFNDDLKLGKKLKYIIYKLNDSKTEIVVEKTSDNKDYEAFIADLPENDCRYAAYDFEFDSADTSVKKTKILFYAWSPDTAKVMSKMVYASSKDALKNALGIEASIQGTDFAEVAYETILEKVAGKKSAN